MIEKILDVVLRAVCGTIGIYFINLYLESREIFLGVGINLFTFLTSGILGLPGLAALYGIGIIRNL